jgi:hypothetical protein
MTHRAGHVEDSGEDVYSMDRRKYLSTLAAGAAFGTVAVGLAACGGSGGGGESASTGDTASTGSEPAADSASANRLEMAVAGTEITGKNLWGYLRVFPPEVTTVRDAKPELLANVKTIRIPYYNNTELDMSNGPVVGFHLLTIGCPAKFALAINLTRDDHHPGDMPPTSVIVQRHKDMDAALLLMGYKAEDWKGMDTAACPP